MFLVLLKGEGINEFILLSRLRAYLAGYPDLFFSFHSLRSGILSPKFRKKAIFTLFWKGFITTKLMVAYEQGQGGVHDAMVETALIAQWQPFSRGKL